jgi:hypothetical protein
MGELKPRLSEPSPCLNVLRCPLRSRDATSARHCVGWLRGLVRRAVTSVAPDCVDDQLCRMIRKLKSGEFRLYSRKKNPRTGKRRNLGTFKTLAAAKRHERAVQFFKRH